MPEKDEPITDFLKKNSGKLEERIKNPAEKKIKKKYIYIGAGILGLAVLGIIIYGKLTKPQQRIRILKGPGGGYSISKKPIGGLFVAPPTFKNHAHKSIAVGKSTSSQVALAKKQTASVDKRISLSDLFKLPLPKPVKTKKAVPFNQELVPRGRPYYGRINDLISKFKGFKSKVPAGFGASVVSVLGVSGNYAVISIGKSKYYVKAGENIGGYEILSVDINGIKVSHLGHIKFMGVSQ